jgi:hypothetical protein
MAENQFTTSFAHLYVPKHGHRAQIEDTCWERAPSQSCRRRAPLVAPPLPGRHLLGISIQGSRVHKTQVSASGPMMFTTAQFYALQHVLKNLHQV